jgi:hypothetical protein
MPQSETTPSVNMLAARLAEIDEMTEEEAKAELAAQRTKEFFSSRHSAERAASKSGSHKLELEPASQRGGGKRPRGHLTIGAAVLESCRGKWLTPDEIVEAVGRLRPGTNDASVYPEIMRAKKANELLHKQGRYMTA